MTFVFYARTIPLLTLRGFLECDIDKVTKLANFLGLKGYSMIDQREVSLPTRSPDKVMLLRTSDSLSYKILELQSFLQKIDTTTKEIYENMIKEAISQIHINFEPWKNYEPIFSFLSETLKDRNWINLEVENGRIVKLRSYYREIELPSKIWLRDFLIKISPIVSAGTVSYTHLTLPTKA